MLVFTQFNINPKGKKTGDCSIRAVANTLSISWDEALDELVEMSHKTKIDTTDKKNVDKVMEKHGWVKKKQPRKLDNTKYTVKEMDKITTKSTRDNRILLLVANHYTSINGNSIEDTWDCGYKTVGNYWVKEDLLW